MMGKLFLALAAIPVGLFMVGFNVPPPTREAKLAAMAYAEAAKAADAAEDACRRAICGGHLSTGETAMLVTVAEGAATARFRGPSTFPWVYEVRVKVERGKPCTFVAQDYVDAQNSSGATVRADWTARLGYLSPRAASSRWRPSSPASPGKGTAPSIPPPCPCGGAGHSQRQGRQGLATPPA